MFTSKIPFRIGTIAIVLMMTLGTAQPAYAAPPTNDNFVNATVIPSLPFSISADTYDATSEPGEPNNCGDYSPWSVWFSYTPPETTSLTASASYSYYPPVIAVYTGSSVGSLTPVICGNYYPSLTFQALGGVTYYFQLSTFYAQGTIPFSLDVTPSPYVGFYYSPYDPSIFDNISFYSNIYDPVYIYGGTYAWNFGDGKTSADANPSQQYAKDGDYTVSLVYKTSDGRTASSSSTIQVRTRDVAITKFSVPQTAKSNTTKEIAVEVTNRRYSDNVQVQLFKGLPGGGEQLIGTLTIYVPARANRATLFKFSYTFTGCDATIGKVTFRTEATLMGGREALPADNTAIRTTLVTGTKGPCGPISYP